MSPQPVDQIDWERYEQLNRLGLPGLTGYEGSSSLSGPDVMHHAEGGTPSARRKETAQAKAHRPVRVATAGVARQARGNRSRSFLAQLGL
jgi:hypothetical protein